MQQGIADAVREAYSDIIREPIFCMLFGSAVHDEERAEDIDILLLTEKALTSKDKQRITKTYFELHERFGKRPSYAFPGENTHYQQIKHAWQGKGFYLDSQDRPIIKEVHDHEWNDYTDHRFYLCVLSNQSKLLYGDEQAYEHVKERSFDTLARIVMATNQQEQHHMTGLRERIIGTGKLHLGFYNDDKSKAYLAEQLRRRRNGLATDEQGTITINDNAPTERIIAAIKAYQQETKA